MKHLSVSIVAAGSLAATILCPATASAASAKAAMTVTIIAAKPTTVTQQHRAVTFHLRVRGLVLDALHMGKANVPGHGHIQLYVDRVPRDAYVRKDLKHYWLAALATTTISLNLSPAIVGGAGKHRIIVALARNNFVLYKAPMAAVSLSVR